MNVPMETQKHDPFDRASDVEHHIEQLGVVKDDKDFHVSRDSHEHT